MDTNIVIVLVVSVIAIIAAVLITAKVTTTRLKKNAEGTIGNAEEKAREIIDEALKTAENKKRESLLEVKEESIRTKNELDKEIKERRAEAQRYERRVQQKEENIDKKADAIEKREASLAAREETLGRMKEEVSKLNEQRVQELERISGLTSEQAKDYLLKIVEDEVKHETAVMIKEMESRAKEEADKKAKEYVVNAIQRCAADHVSETTISVVQLPNDEMKGRIIGREGRNIRTLETMTGVDLIIDDTPEAVILSGFDPIRREVARIALEKLIVDGRIHPARIEEMVEKAQKEVEVMIKEEGEAATLEVGVHGIHPELVRLLGKMKFRTSYGQNALKHSIEVAQLSGLLAAELGLDVRLAKRAGLLHDIGKAVDHEMEGSHIQLGAELCRKYKENATVINAVESHHGDVEPTSLIACIVQAADTISAARPGARRETLETYTSRLRQLEDITNNFKGVDKSFAIQAGREVRVMVVPEQISDADMVLLARDISKQIEAELEYPGLLAAELGLDVRLAKRAGLLHDIGKAVDHEMEGSHIQLGAELCRKYKENATVINAVESHHGDVEPTSLIACIVQAADTISAARPGARRETLETYTSRLRQLEDITNNFKGVDKSFAIQAGREVRVMVVPEQISDADMVLLARDISKQIEAELEYPGQIKVNVIRESRVIDYAK